MADCSTCALQYKDACPHQFDKVITCSKYIEKHFDPQPPRRGGRYYPEPGEYPGGRRTPPRPETRSLKHHSPIKYKPKVKEGQRLFYRDKNTGIIQYGAVTAVYKDGFDYVFDGRIAFLSYDVIGTRLFFSWKGAWQHYRKTKTGRS